MSESCNTFANKLNQNESAGKRGNKENESFLKIINIPNIATTTSVEPAMTTDGNKNNVNANIITFDDIFNDKNLMNFAFQTIEQLEVRPTYFDEFEEFLKSRYELYGLNYSSFGENVNYKKAIEKLFRSHATMSVVQEKMSSKFPLTTQDVFYTRSYCYFSSRK